MDGALAGTTAGTVGPKLHGRCEQRIMPIVAPSRESRKVFRRESFVRFRQWNSRSISAGVGNGRSLKLLSKHPDGRHLTRATGKLGAVSGLFCFRLSFSAALFCFGLSLASQQRGTVRLKPNTSTNRNMYREPRCAEKGKQEVPSSRES
jgi:hypothetical protein